MCSARFRLRSWTKYSKASQGTKMAAEIIKATAKPNKIRHLAASETWKRPRGDMGVLYPLTWPGGRRRSKEALGIDYAHADTAKSGHPHSHDGGHGPGCDLWLRFLLP